MINFSQTDSFIFIFAHKSINNKTISIYNPSQLTSIKIFCPRKTVLSTLIFKETEEGNVTIDEATTAAKEDGEKSGGEEGGAAEDKPKEEEPKQMTLDEWKAQQSKSSAPKFNLRKAGEGADIDSKWKKAAIYKKEKEDGEEDEDDDDQVVTLPIQSLQEIAQFLCF